MNCKICGKNINYGQEYCSRCFDVYKVPLSNNKPYDVYQDNKVTAEPKFDKKFYQIDSDQIAVIREALIYITWNWNRLKEVEAILNNLKEIPSNFNNRFVISDLPNSPIISNEQIMSLVEKLMEGHNALLDRTIFLRKEIEKINAKQTEKGE